jgi:hypothetical protein
MQRSLDLLQQPLTLPDDGLQLLRRLLVLLLQLPERGELQLAGEVVRGQGIDEGVDVLGRAGDERGEQLRVVVRDGRLVSPGRGLVIGR